MKLLRCALAAAAVIASGPVVSTQTVPDRPAVITATYWGTPQSEEHAAVALDAAGNAYVAAGGLDVTISKFNPAGALVATMVFGGSGSEYLGAIAVDGGGNIIIAGYTFSPDLPAVNAVQPAFHPGGCGEFGGICADGFLAKLDPAGAIVFSTYLGTPAQDKATDVAVDPAGNVYVVGTTDGPFADVTPVRPANWQDAFVAKFAPGGGPFTYLTYLGGAVEDAGHGIAADAAGNAYVTGVTGSQNFPTLNPIQASPGNFSNSAFVTKLGPAGAIVYSTYLGGEGNDMGFDIAVDAAGGAHVAGITGSTSFPVVNPRQAFLRGFNDVFVARLAPSGASLVYSTYLGGSDREQAPFDFVPALKLALDTGGNAYVTGLTQSADFPSLYPVQAFGGGACLAIPFLELWPCPDAFVSKLDPAGGLAFSTTIGGSRDDRGRGIAVAPDGVVHLVGTTVSPDFPVKAPLQGTLSGSSDAFIVTIATAPPACQLPAPRLLAPMGGIFTPTPVFSWEPVQGAEAYAAFAFNAAHVALTGTPPAQLLGVTAGTTVTPAAPLPTGDYLWQVVAWNSACGLGALGRGAAVTLPGTCPAPKALPFAPVRGALVPNPTRLEWGVPGPSIAALSIVVILRSNGQFVAQYATAGNSFTLPITLSTGDYTWFVITWSSTCGFTASAPASFRSTGGVVQ